MPNGAPGDHPITDIVVHGKTVYTPTVDRLIEEIVRQGFRDRIELKLFHDYSPYENPDVERLEAELRDLLDELGGAAEGGHGRGE